MHSETDDRPRASRNPLRRTVVTLLRTQRAEGRTLMQALRAMSTDDSSAVTVTPDGDHYRFRDHSVTGAERVMSPCSRTLAAWWAEAGRQLSAEKGAQPSRVRPEAVLQHSRRETRSSGHR